MRLAATLQEGIEEAGVNIGRANYEFEGWYETEKGGVQFDPAAPLLEPKEIYAHWKPIEHTLRFDYNYPGPNPQDEPAVVEIPGNCETPLALTQMNTPEYPHYTFKGWCTAEGVEYNPPGTIEETRTVYARWEGKQYSITFYAGEGVSPQGEAEQTVTVTYPAKAAAAYPPAKANHGFTGWYTLPDGGEPFTPYTPPDNNAKFYAHWEEGLATLTLNYNHDAKAELKSSLLNGTLNFIEKP
ncbi:MAG: InlB B-repeat-containing protein, partial [Spirochaetaceae bacterium]|nr:InlB B-repeat-containing protein [Spirochaetaceae bacterium]